MADAYVEGKVRDALAAAKGSRATAQRLLITWAAEDPRLLLGMAQPFLKAICGAAVERAVRQVGGGSGVGASGGSGGLSREALSRVLSRLGDDPAPSGAVRMQSATMAVPARGQAAPDGASHEKAMMTLAKAFATKKGR